MRVAGAIIVVVLALLLAGCGGGAMEKGSSAPETKGSSSTTAGSELSTVTIQASGGREVEVRVEISDTPAEQELGLMNRTALGENRGMLFVFPDERIRVFWMKNTLIPLSIAYIDSEGRIVDIQDMKPLDDEAPHYNSAEPAQYALEVNKGFFEEHGVKVGDEVELPG